MEPGREGLFCLLLAFSQAGKTVSDEYAVEASCQSLRLASIRTSNSLGFWLTVHKHSFSLQVFALCLHTSLPHLPLTPFNMFFVLGNTLTKVKSNLTHKG